jgi:iron complex outermembrane receptor protein
MRFFVLALLAPAVLAPALFTPSTLLAQADSSRARRDTTTLETVTVSAIRARGEAPIAAQTLSAREIQARSFGQDVPLLLQGTPSLTSYSETGNHWGYSYMRIRGIDQSRINLTIDGIPLNDPEDQVLYFADFPDLANSLSSIQIQRGVGTSAPGTASYGGSINFETVPVASARRGGDAQLQGGSFGSGRVSAEYATGPLDGGFALYARASALQSAGYRHHSGMEGRSAFLAGAWVGPRQMLKLTYIAGLFADTMAYLGATEADLALDRRVNYLRPDEVDRFGEQVAALAYTRQLTPSATLASTVYRTSASGNYDVCISACDQPVGDLWNFNLDFRWYGVTNTLTHEGDRHRLSVGAHASSYARDHHAYARPDVATPLYFNTGHKRDASAFIKASYDIGRVTLFGDAQARRAEFRYTPDANAGVEASSIAWSFLNPKAGATVRVGRALEAYASYGINSREPARSDMFAGFDNIDASNVDFVGPLTRVRPERVGDLEAGGRLRAAWGTLQLNAFAMEFVNEILPVGELSYIGTPLRTNVEGSRRRGVELDLTARPIERIEVAANVTAMRGRITRYTDATSGVTYEGTEPILTPRFTAAQRVTAEVTSSLSLTASSRQVGRSFLTNASDASLVLPGHAVTDLGARLLVGRTEATLLLNNLTDTRRYGGGHVSAGTALYYVLPPRNVFLQLKVLF